MPRVLADCGTVLDHRCPEHGLVSPQVYVCRDRKYVPCGEWYGTVSAPVVSGTVQSLPLR